MAPAAPRYPDCLPQGQSPRYPILATGSRAEAPRRCGGALSGASSPMPRSRRRPPRPAPAPARRRRWRFAILTVLTSWNRYQVGRVIGGLILTWLVGAGGLYLAERRTNAGFE